MKKLLSVLFVCTVVAGAVVSCGDSDSGSKKSKKKDKTSEVVGKWSMPSISEAGVDDGGIEFGENGKGSIWEETSSLLYFEEGGLNVGGTLIDSQYIDFDGKTLAVSMSGQDMLTIERTGEENADTYDGEYTLESGILYDALVSSFADEENADLDVYISFDGDTSNVYFPDLFDYKIDGDKMTISGMAAFLMDGSDEEEVEVTFEVDGDTLKMTDDKGDTEELTRVK